MSHSALFHQHLDVCQRCRENPFDLCQIGAAILTSADEPPAHRIENDPRYTSLREEYAATQEQLVNLAHALGIDAEERWDHDSCPNNSDIAKELTEAANALASSHAQLVEALERIVNGSHDLYDEEGQLVGIRIDDIDIARAALIAAKGESN